MGGRGNVKERGNCYDLGIDGSLRIGTGGGFL